MAASNSTTTTTNGRSGRTGTTKAIVVLKLSPEILGRFPNPASNVKATPVKASSNTTSNFNNTNSSSPVKENEGSPASSSVADPPVPPSDNASDAASTPAGAPSAETPRRKGLPGPKPGSKRGHNQGDSVPKPRGKPGPKKKQKIEDGAVEPAKVATGTGAGHRLGPKANTGTINANLRALDRTGAPCRKWQRKPLQLKSFTGIMWQLPSWRTPKPPKIDENGETKEAVLEAAESDSKVNHSASGVPSEKSNSGDGDLTPAPPPMVDASSPAIPMAV